MRSDAALMRAARKDAGRVPRAVRPLCGAHLRRSTLRARADADAAFDLTAETFAQAWLVRRRFRDEANGSAAPWLFGIARHLVAQSVRSRRIESRAVRAARDSRPARRGAGDRRTDGRVARRPRRGVRRSAGRPACRRRAARDRRARLRRRRGRSRHDSGRRARARRARARPAQAPTLGNRKRGSLMTDLNSRLDRLGSALEQRAAGDLRA